VKKLFVIAAAIGLFGMTSCKKDYSCSCAWDVGGVQQAQTWDYGKQKKSDAEDACASQEAQLKLIDSGASCSLD